MAPSTAFPFPSHLPLTAPNPAHKAPARATRQPSTDTTSVVTTLSPPNSPSCVTITTEPTPPQSTLSQLSTLYSPLPRTEQTHLLQLTHFIHLHAQSLQLSPYELLTPVEESILRRSGKPYEALVKTLSPQRKRDEEPTLEQLLNLTDTLHNTLRDNYHKPYPVTSTKIGANPHELHACARPTRVQDSRNDHYIWIRGCSNISPRIARNDVLLTDPLKHAEMLRIRGGRKDVFVSGWIASRVETAERVARNVRVEGEKEERERRERERREELARVEMMERQRRKKEDRGRWLKERQERERLGVGVMTRRRHEVCYAESEEDGDGEGEEREFVCDEFIDGSDHDESDCGSDGEEEEESEREDARVVGRRRVWVSERSRRAEKRARLAEKYGSEDEDEDEDEGERGVRRSRRLRTMKA